MKKTILLAMAILAGASVASAQSRIVNNPDNKSYVGVRLNIESAVPGNVEYANNKVGVQKSGAGLSIGAIYNKPIVANFYVEPGLELYYNTTKFNENNLSLENLRWKSNSTRSAGMRIPVMLGYHFDFSPKVNVAVATGPVLKVGFFDDYYMTTETMQNPVTGNAERLHYSGSMYKPNSFNEVGEYELSQNRVDCAWRISIGVNFLKHYYVGLSGDIGMVNQIKNTNNGAYKMKNNLFQLNLGYNF